jgi:hypothetical protein
LLLSAANQQQNRPRWFAVCIDPPKSYGIGVAERPQSPVLPVLSGRDQAFANSLIEIPNPLAATDSMTVRRVYGNCGVVT